MFSFFLSFAFTLYVKQHEEKSFLTWMRQNNQFFTGEEYHFRLGVFLANARHVCIFNSAENTFKVSLNKFTCHTPHEYESLLGRHSSHLNGHLQIPDEIDWRSKGVVNAVKDQGNCGASWAFGAIQACESAYALKHGILNVCSEQNLIDCVVECTGCGGGQALNYISKFIAFLTSI